MKRNIIATIKFMIGIVNISVLEKLSTNMVEIFNISSETKKVHSFIATSLKKIETLIGGKLNKVAVIIEPTKNTNAKIKIHKEQIVIAGDAITEQDITNVVELTKKQFENENKKTILVQPIKFDVFNVMTKSYSKAPIHKIGTKLTVTSTITTISSETYDFINQAIRAHGLTISQILLIPQAITQNNMSHQILESGSVMIHLGLNQSFITINKNLATIAMLSIYDFGFNNLVSGITKVFGCSKNEAKNLIMVYGNLDNLKMNRIIYTYRNGISEKVFLLDELREIMKIFFSKLFIVSNKFISQKSASALPVVLSGLLDGIEHIKEFAKNSLSSKYISQYNPISFIELNHGNIETIGMSNFMNIMDEVLGIQFNTIIDTNPSTISSLKKQKTSKTLFAKIANRLGGKYVWN